MDANLTESANRTLILANEEAHRLNHKAIEPEHILLGLGKGHAGLGVVVLRDMGIDIDKLCAEVEEVVGKGAHGPSTSQLPQSTRALRVIKYAVEKARGRRRRYNVGTEHILLGVLSEGEGIAARTLMNLGLTLDNVAERIHTLEEAGAEDTEPDKALEEPPTIDLYVDPGSSSVETIQEVLMALSDLHVTAGGLGLEFINDGQFICAIERAER